MLAAGWGSIIAISSPRTTSTAAWGDRPNAPPQSIRTRTVKRAMQKSKRKISRAGAARKPAKMYRTSMRDVPKVAGLKRKDGWVDMQVQFLIDKASAGADHEIGRASCRERGEIWG